MRTLIISALALAMPTTAQATVLSYDFAGTFVDGRSMSGSFSFDDSYSNPRTPWEQFFNAHLTLTGEPEITSIAGTNFLGLGSISYYGIGFGYSALSEIIYVGVQGTTSPDNWNLRSITSNALALSNSFIFSRSGGAIPLLSGTISPAAVPETATWAMMLMGFGAIGAAARRPHRRQSA